jgi:hypothetical protein
MTVRNIPGRMSIAQNQLLFKVILPPLGFNTYYFQMKSLTGEERLESSVKVTYNEECILKNQVTYLNDPNLNKSDRLFL